MVVMTLADPPPAATTTSPPWSPGGGASPASMPLDDELDTARRHARRRGPAARRRRSTTGWPAGHPTASCGCHSTPPLTRAPTSRSSSTTSAGSASGWRGVASPARGRSSRRCAPCGRRRTSSRTCGDDGALHVRSSLTIVEQRGQRGHAWAGHQFHVLAPANGGRRPRRRIKVICIPELTAAVPHPGVVLL